MSSVSPALLLVRPPWPRPLCPQCPSPSPGSYPISEKPWADNGEQTVQATDFAPGGKQALFASREVPAAHGTCEAEGPGEAVGVTLRQVFRRPFPVPARSIQIFCCACFCSLPRLEGLCFFCVCFCFFFLLFIKKSSYLLFQLKSDWVG